MPRPIVVRAALLPAALLLACASDSTPAPLESEVCAATADVDFLPRLGCQADFTRLASTPIDASIPGARSVKVILDRADGDTLYFQNSQRFRVHYDFASRHLSGRGRPPVPSLAAFNASEYYAPDRRFVLGAVTRYEGADLYVLQIAPYDTASVAMIERLFRAVAAASFFGGRLAVHPTSDAVTRQVDLLPKDVPRKSTEQIFEGISLQPLNPGESVGRLRFVSAARLAKDEYVSFREIVVIDRVPNDISVVAGLITEAFQTPLSHVNVLSQNRGTPNMALRGAFQHPALRGLEGKWVRLRVGRDDWSVSEVSAAEAEAWWQAHRPARVQVPRLDRDEGRLLSATAILDAKLPLRDAIRAAIPAFGGKAAHFAALAGSKGVPVPTAFAVPVRPYLAFLAQHGFDRRVQALLDDPAFRDDTATRDRRLEELRKDMRAAPLDPAFEAEVTRRLAEVLPGLPARFRSSTNAEDLEGFTGAGLYKSETGIPGDPDKSVANAIRRVWASVFRLRAFDERTFRGIDHASVGMALLVHRAFPDEEANGVALTANPFDPERQQPGFYVNVQKGGASVVLPEAGTTTEQLLLHHEFPGQPVVVLARSSLVPRGQSVLSPLQVRRLGEALQLIHRHFLPAYGSSDPNRPYAMDVEFKLDGPPGAEPELFIKQARPFARTQ